MAPFGVVWGGILETFLFIFEVCENSEKCNPSQAKTTFLRFGEGPMSHLFDNLSGCGF